MRRTILAGMSGLTGLSLLAVAGWMLFSAPSPMPEALPDKKAWLHTQAQNYAPRIAKALEKTKVAGGPLAFDSIQVYPEQSRVDIVYSGDKAAFSEFANAQHGRPWDVMRYANFELRKSLCKNYQRTAMKGGALGRLRDRISTRPLPDQVADAQGGYLRASAGQGPNDTFVLKGAISRAQSALR